VGLRATYNVYLGLIEKRVFDFLFLVSLGVTAEALRAKIARKSAHCKRVGHYPPNFRIEGDIPHQSFVHG